MKRLVVGLFLFLFLPVQASWFGYDRGIAAAHDGDSERAEKLLTDELTSYPENPELLYDNGVFASRQKKYEQAEAFFSKTVVFTPSESPLHRQALFNLGNSCVGANQLREALNAYNQLLALDPQHKKAQHNRDVVKKMLEQQAQDQEKNGSQKNNQEQKDSQQDTKNNQGNSKQQHNRQGSDKNSPEQQQGKQQDGSAEGQQQGQQSDSAGKQKQQSAKNKQSSEKDAANNGQQSEECPLKDQRSIDQKSTGQKNSDQQSPNSASPDETSRNQDNQKRDGKDSNQLDERDGYKERYGKRDNNTDGKNKQRSGDDKAEDMKSNTDDKEGDNDQHTQHHDDSPSRARDVHKDVTTTKTMKVGSKVQESAKKETKKQYAAWAESMLDAVQLNDEALNKVLVQRAVAGTMGGRDGECCW